MARLIDGLLAHKFKEKNVNKLLKQAEVVVIDNVSRFYFEVSTKDRWILTDFPNLAPPFETFFMEFKAPSFINVDGKRTEIPPTLRKVELGSLFTVLDHSALPDDLDEDMIAISEKIKDYGDVRWTVTAFPFLRQHGYIMEPNCAWTFMVNSDGTPTLDEKGEPSFMTSVNKDNVARMDKFRDSSHMEIMHHFRDLGSFFLDPCLLAISFMHCKNVTLARNAQSPSLAKAYQKKHGKPLARYYTLDIEPMKKVLSAEGDSGQTGLKQALHICRGHFKNFSKGKGLFGKYKGLYWWDSQVRGSMDEGVIDKDYRVKTPA